jgi:ribosome maturation factor RimP
MTVAHHELEQVCEQALAPLGYALVALEFVREQQGWVLRIFIERGDGQAAVSLEDCTRASRDVSAALDVADLIEQRYSLEVSSPGLERPLVRERDFARFAGHRARMRTREPIEGRRNFSGVLKGAVAGQIEIDCDGRSYHVPVDGVAKAHLEYDLPAPGRKE